LPKCPSMGKMTTDSTYEWRKIGEQVSTAPRRCRHLENNALSTRHSEKTRAGLARTLFREFKVWVQKIG
jgi:hypothetical protein